MRKFAYLNIATDRHYITPMIHSSISERRMAARRATEGSSKKAVVRRSRLLKVSVFGLGYVGSVTSACLANKGHEVWGVDVDPRKVSLINSGKSPLYEPGLDEIISSCGADGLIRATGDVEAALLATDASIVCVRYPIRGDGSLDLTYVHDVVGSESLTFCGSTASSTRSVAQHHVAGDDGHAGGARIFADLVESKQIEIYYCPEFLREGTAIADFDTPPSR